MATKLKAKPPGETKPGKTKQVIFGPSGVGKTWFALSFPVPYYIDTEGGADLAHYQHRLKEAGGVYMGPEEGALDFDTVLGQMQALATEKHGFKTLIIDSLTKLYQTAIAQEAERLGPKDAFGASKKPAIAYMRRMMAWSMRLDMNILMVCHETAEWGVDGKTGQRQEVGKIADCWEKTSYELDLSLQCQKFGPRRVAIVRKSRLMGFPEGESFDLNYTTFAEKYGKDIIESAAVVITLASNDQVNEICRLVKLLHISEEQQDKWLTKASASKFSEFTDDQAAKLIKMLTDKLTSKQLSDEDQLP